MEKWLFRLISPCLRHPAWTVAIYAVLVVLGGWLSTRLDFHSDFVELLPKDTEEIRDLNYVAEKMGGENDLVVAIDARDREIAKRFATDLAERLQGNPRIVFVETKLNVDFLREHKLLLVPPQELARINEDLRQEVEKRKADANPLFIGLDDEEEEKKPEPLLAKATDITFPVDEWTFGNDGKYLYVMVKPKGRSGDMTFGRLMFTDVKQAVAELNPDRYLPGLKIEYTGTIVLRMEEDAVMKRDMITSSIVSLLGCMALLVLITRRWRSLPAVGFPLVGGMALTFGITYLLIGYVNIVTGFLCSVLMGLGIDYGVHIFMRYQEERTRHDDQTAVSTAVRDIGRATITAATTTIAAFVTLMLAKFSAFHEFGIICTIGIAVTFFSMQTVCPSLILLSHKVRLRAPSAYHDDAAVTRGVNLPRWFKRAVLIATPAFAFLGLFALLTGRVEFNYNWRELKGESPASDFSDYVDATIGRAVSPVVIMTRTAPEAAKIEAALQRSIERDGEKSPIKSFLSINTLVPPDQRERLLGVAELRRTLLSIKPSWLNDEDRGRLREALKATEVKPFTAAEAPFSLKRRFIAADGSGVAVLCFPRRQLYDLQEIFRWIDAIDEISNQLRGAGVELHVLSENRIAARVFRLVLGDIPFIGLACSLAVFILMLLDFRSFRRAALVFGSLAAGLIGVAAFMWFWGLKLNMINAVVLPTAIGVGIDNAVYIYHRYLAEGKGSAGRIIRFTGKAAMLASVTTAAGFGSMIIAHHAGLRSVGELALIAISVPLLATTLFFPLFLEWLESWRRPSPPA